MLEAFRPINQGLCQANNSDYENWINLNTLADPISKEMPSSYDSSNSSEDIFNLGFKSNINDRNCGVFEDNFFNVIKASQTSDDSALLINSYKILPLGGMIAVVTFHSLEDKIVKFFFKNYSEKKNSSRYLPNNTKNKILFKLSQKKPILPDINEIKKNPPSRSAKLRYAIKIKEDSDFSDFIKKFEYFLNLENLSEKL